MKKITKKSLDELAKTMVELNTYNVGPGQTYMSGNFTYNGNTYTYMVHNACQNKPPQCDLNAICSYDHLGGQSGFALQNAAQGNIVSIVATNPLANDDLLNYI